MKNRLSFSLVLAFLFSAISFAQTVEDVTLVTSASAPTEEEAIVLALRSSIEQTYGSFVSANTTILNDELVRDEIVSVSHGNVKSYEKLSSNVLPNGQVAVTLKSTISISNLVSFAKSKGATAEFAGQTFSMNMKLMKLKEKNALAAYENMCIQAGEMLDGAFDYKIDLEEPVLKQISYRESGEPKTESGYMFKVNVKVLATPRTSQIYELITNTLESIRLTAAEVEDFKKVGRPVYNYSKAYLQEQNWWARENFTTVKSSTTADIFLPIDKDDRDKIQSLNEELCEKARKAFLNYSLVEIANEESYISWHKQVFVGKKVSYDDCGWNKDDRELTRERKNQYDDYYLENSNGLAFTSFADLLSPTMDSHGLLNEMTHSGNHKNVFLPRLRIDLGSNWNKWELPKIEKRVPVQDPDQPSSEKSSKKKSKKSQPMKVVVEYASVEKVISEYSLPYFITENQLESFAGLKVQIPSNTLQIGTSAPEEISSILNVFFPGRSIPCRVSTRGRNEDVSRERYDWNLNYSPINLKYDMWENTLTFPYLRSEQVIHFVNIEQKWHQTGNAESACLFEVEVSTNNSGTSLPEPPVRNHVRLKYHVLLRKEGKKSYMYLIYPGSFDNYNYGIVDYCHFTINDR